MQSCDFKKWKGTSGKKAVEEEKSEVEIEEVLVKKKKVAEKVILGWMIFLDNPPLSHHCLSLIEA